VITRTTNNEPREAASAPRAATQRVAGSARRLGTLAGLFGLCLLLWILTPHFLTVSNLLNVLE
jgi:hypothetical protein